MRLKSLLLTCFVAFLASLSSLQAQDVHFTMYDMVPVYTNPAFTGNFEGTARVSGIYREQFRSVFGGGNQYQTFMVNVDAPLLMIGKNNWLGVGGLLMQDNAGFFGMSQGRLMGSAAFHKGLDKKMSKVLTFGISVGQTSYSTDDQFNINDLGDNRVVAGDASRFVGGNGMSQDRLEALTGNHLDFGVGVAYKGQVNKKTAVQFGVMANRLLTPNKTLLQPAGNAASSELPIRIRLTAESSHQLNDKWSVQPKAFVNMMGPSNELLLQGWGNYLFNEERNMRFKFGIGTRMVRDAILLLGFQQDRLTIQGAYDFNLAFSEATNNRGGWEIAGKYLLNIYKNPEVPPVILCPEL